MIMAGDSLFDWTPPPMAHARHRDPETSKEAAKSVDVTRGQIAILAALTVLGPSSDERIFAHVAAAGMNLSESGARTRRSELVALGRVRFTGKFGETKTGRKTRIWELDPDYQEPKE